MWLPQLDTLLIRIMGQDLMQTKSPNYVVGFGNALMRFDGVNPLCKVGKACVTDDGTVVCIPRNRKCRNSVAETAKGKTIREALTTAAIAGAAGLGVAAMMQSRSTELQRGAMPYADRTFDKKESTSTLDKLKTPLSILGAGIAGGLLTRSSSTISALNKKIAQHITSSQTNTNKNRPSSPPSPPSSPPPSPSSPPPSPSSPPPSPSSPPPPASPTAPSSASPVARQKLSDRKLTTPILPSGENAEEGNNLADSLLERAQTAAEAVQNYKNKSQELRETEKVQQELEALKQEKQKLEQEKQKLEQEKMDLVSVFEQSEAEYQSIIEQYQRQIAELEQQRQAENKLREESGKFVDEAVAEITRLRQQVKDLEAAKEGITAQKLELLVNDPNANARQQYAEGTLLIERVPTEAILVDPKRFQYKQNAKSTSGTTGSLAEQTAYHELVAGALDVWRDPADGKIYVVNGHNRLDLAKRTNTPEVAVNYLQVATAQEARLLGAMLNIADERGTNKDAAILFRAITQDENLSIDKQYATALMQSHRARNGIALSSLADDVWNNYLEGKISEPVAIEIGKAANKGLLTEDDQRFITSMVMKSPSDYGAEDVEYLIGGIQILKEMGKIDSKYKQLGLFPSGSDFSSEELEANAKRLALISQELLSPLKDIKTLANKIKRVQLNQESFTGTLIEAYAKQLSEMNPEQARQEAKKLYNFVKTSLADPSSPLVQDVIIPLANEMRQIDDADVKKYLAQRNLFAMMAEKYQQLLNPLAQQSDPAVTIQPRIISPEHQSSPTGGSDASVRTTTTTEKSQAEATVAKPKPTAEIAEPRQGAKIEQSPAEKRQTQRNKPTPKSPPPPKTEVGIRLIAEEQEALRQLTQEVRKNMTKSDLSVVSKVGDDEIKAKIVRTEQGWSVLVKGAQDTDFREVQSSVPTKQRAITQAELWILGEGLSSIHEKRRKSFTQKQNNEQPETKSDSLLSRYLRTYLSRNFATTYPHPINPYAYRPNLRLRSST